MSAKKIIIYTLGVAIIVFVISFFTYDSSLDSDYKNALGESDITKKSYGYPLIKMLNYNDKIIVDAGIYRFGDIDQNGEVGKTDVEALMIMIDSKNIGFTNGQIKLADVNEDGMVNESDLNLFNSYLEVKGEVKYNLNDYLLEYCFSEDDDSTNCVWQKEKEKEIDKEKDYYVFVKNIKTDAISDLMFLDKKVFINKESKEK